MRHVSSHIAAPKPCRYLSLGLQREPAIRAVLAQNFVVTSMADVSGVAHNGVRPPKRRRT